jgi:large subunit ribosomal protein L3
MAGHMGDDRVTERSLEVIKVDPAQNLLLVKGPVPGPNGGFVVLRESVRLSRRKQTVLKTGK